MRKERYSSGEQEVNCLCVSQIALKNEHKTLLTSFYIIRDRPRHRVSDINFVTEEYNYAVCIIRHRFLPDTINMSSSAVNKPTTSAKKTQGYRKITLYKVGENAYALARGTRTASLIKQGFEHADVLATVTVSVSVKIATLSGLVRHKSSAKIPVYHRRKDVTESALIERYNSYDDINAKVASDNRRYLFRLSESNFAIANGAISRKRILERFPFAVKVGRINKTASIHHIKRTSGLVAAKSHMKGVVILRPRHERIPDSLVVDRFTALSGMF